MIIRNEKPEDYRVVEEMIKKAFWNLAVPGCNEHYFAHQVRKSEDYIPELDFVMEENGQIIGHILYVKAKLVATDGTEKRYCPLARLRFIRIIREKDTEENFFIIHWKQQRKWDTTRLQSMEIPKTMPVMDLKIVKDIMFAWMMTYILLHSW